VTIAERIRGSLAAKLLLITAAISVVLALLISGIEIWRDSRATFEAEQGEARAAVTANIDTIALAVWAFDERVLDVTARSLLRGTSIVHVEISEDGETRLKLDRPGPPLQIDYAWEAPLLRPSSSQRIGTLRLAENYDEVRDQIRRRAAVFVITELTKIFATSTLLFFVAYFLITRPLRVLAHKVQGGEDREDAGSIAIGRPLRMGHDEIDALIDAINSSNATRQRMQAEQRRHQAREANAGKLEALGQLAGGIAHDFNNILGAILGFAGLLRDDLQDNPKERRFVQRILVACERGRELIGQIRTFARAEGTERKPIDLVRVVRQNEQLLAASLPKSTQLRFHYPSSELAILGNEALLGQLVANLCINANEALDGQAGIVSISLDRALASELEKLRTAGPAAGERIIGQIDASNAYVCLKVADTAGGITESVLDRIFEPFFTTKGRQRGTGLGLAVVHGVIESHGGACHVASRPGEGTIFSVYLPLCPAPAVELPARRLVPEKARGTERILIVDDEPDIVDMLSIGLERLGYETVGVSDPLEALAAFEEDPNAWDIVITDEVMPGMRGLELIRKLKAIRPEIRIVLCTGYSDTPNDEIIRGNGIDVFLLKPVDAAAIASKLRELMDAPAAT
jgi:signal transduction histidine kinase/ActR/RegA family two-component response regulator